MNANTALLLLGGLVALSVLLGLLIRRTQTRVRRIEDGDARVGIPVPPDVLAAAGEDPPRYGERLTLLQFSSENCARCPATARVLGNAAGARVGVAHIEIDITHRDDVIARFDLLRTPTVLLLDAGGVPLARVSGPLGPSQAAALLDVHALAGGESRSDTRRSDTRCTGSVPAAAAWVSSAPAASAPADAADAARAAAVPAASPDIPERSRP